MDIGSLLYLIADRVGHATVVKYKDRAMQVVRSNRPWLAVTNFYLASASSDQRQQDKRCVTLDRALGRVSGVLSVQEARDLLGAVAQPYTRWSAVYNLSTGDIQLAMVKCYEMLHRFQLPAAQP